MAAAATGCERPRPVLGTRGKLREPGVLRQQVRRMVADPPCWILHRHNNLPCLTAGKLGGKFETGRHLAYKLDTPMSNLLVTIFQNAGVPIGRIGDSTGPLEV